MTTLLAVELGVLGPLQVRRGGATVAIPGAKPRAILAMLGLHGGSVVPASVLVELLWGDAPPRTAAKALQTHISSLRRTLGDGFVVTEGAGWSLAETGVDASYYKAAAKLGRAAAAAGDTSQAVVRFDEALGLWRGAPELPEGQRGSSEKTRWIEAHAALVEDRADALLATGRAAEIVGELEAAVSEAPLRERRWGQLMLALYRAGRQGEALSAYQRARSLLADQLGVDPGPDLRRLEAAVVAQDEALDMPVAQHVSSITRAVTFLLTDIEGSTAAWEADADAMAVALARHDELAERVVTSRGGRLIKTRGEGDATFSVFDRPSAAAAAAIELQDAIAHEPWELQDPMRIRIALHTGEVELRDGDYFGRAVNRAARLRSLAAGGQILCSGATAELVVDSLPDDVALADLGMRQLRNLARPEHVFELRLYDDHDDRPNHVPTEEPVERPELPQVLTGPGPFVGRLSELAKLLSAWQTAVAGGTSAVLIAGEPGVGKTRLAGEWSTQAYERGAIVLYGRCDEDLGAPYQPFAEALRSLVPSLGGSRLRGLRGVEALLPLVPGLTDVVPDLAPPTRADPDTERYALFDAVVALLEVASANAPVVLILDDLHWAAKSTLLLLRHLLRFGERAHVQIVGTYRSTDLDRAHPLAATLADLHRDGTANRIALSGLDEDDVTAYVAEAGYDDEELARALASVTGGNPFFLIEALRHVDESGGVWDQSTLPQGVREAVSRRLSRLPAETNKALAAAAVVGSRFAVDLVERVVEKDLVDALDEACKAGIVIEEPGGHYRFNHALVRQSLLAELPSVRRMRLHQRIALTLESQPGDDDELLAELAHHYFECAWAGNAAKAVEYCRRAADQAMARLAYEGAADLYDHALHALDEIDDDLPNRDEQIADLLVARCEALLAAGDVGSAAGAVSQLHDATRDSARRKAWATCFDGQLSMLIHPGRLDEVEVALGEAATELAGLNDAAGEATAHTVRATCLARLGRIADCEVALDAALTAARRAREHRRVNAVLANAPLAALWGPNPVPRAGGRCLDVVRLLRITTDSPAVEATSIRCQAVLEAFRGRAAAARRMIESARRTVTELGLRHALLEVEQFAGIVELIADDPGAAEPHLRKAYNGFRRMGLDADTAETAALLGRACLALDRDAEADELCSESERLAGHALKASIAWRTLRAQLLARDGQHGEARRVAEAAVALAERTDALVDHGDACLTLASVVRAGGDAAGARAAAQRAVDLYEQKGASALAEKALAMSGERALPSLPPSPEVPGVKPENACVRVIRGLDGALERDAWNEVEKLFAAEISAADRRKIVGFSPTVLSPSDWASGLQRIRETGGVRQHREVVAVRGERLSLTRLEVGVADTSPGAAMTELLHLFGLDSEGQISLHMAFDLEDIDVAIAELDAMATRFEDMPPRSRQLDNRANQVREQYEACIANRDWDAIAKTLAHDFTADDRRSVVNGGVQRGRDTEIATAKFVAEMGASMVTTAIATRGERLVLTHHHLSDGGNSEAFDIEAVDIVEVNAQGQISSHVIFDADDIDAAFTELETRYLAGEAAPHARVWQLGIDIVNEVNRHEVGPTIARLGYTDHRRVPFAAGDFGRAVEELWALVPDARYTTTTVYALDARGAVAGLIIEGTDVHGNQLQWARTIAFDADEPRLEIFEEGDLDAALARFDELGGPLLRLENAASRTYQRLWACFAARDWASMTELVAVDAVDDDRRRVVNAGRRKGRDAAIANIRAIADTGFESVNSTVIAIRGEQLALTSVRSCSRIPQADAFSFEVLVMVRTNADDQIDEAVLFEADAINAALAELDARYLTGEGADYARTWSVIADSYAAMSRHEMPTVAENFADVDHRREASFLPGDLLRYLSAGFELHERTTTYAEAIHRLTDLGAVITHAGQVTSRVGFEGDWRSVDLLTVDGDRVNRVEVFDESDLDAALARFDELTAPSKSLSNGASRVGDRFLAQFAAHKWDAMAATLADDFSSDDRRRLVGAGIRHGRDAQIEDMRAIADLWTAHTSSTVIATRGEHLVLIHVRFAGPHQGPEAFSTEVLSILQINSNEQIETAVSFHANDMSSAIIELDTRYLADEAAAHGPTWQATMSVYDAVNRREIPTVAADWVDVDNRSVAKTESGDLLEYIRASLEQSSDAHLYIEAVDRLTDVGLVVTHIATGKSPDGFDAEWRMVLLMTFEGGLLNRGEVFDESDLDAALARFDELSAPPKQLENRATQLGVRYLAHFAAGDWDAMAAMLATDFASDDRRRVVGSGVQQGPDAQIADMQAMADLFSRDATPTALATRGTRLALMRLQFADRDQGAAAFSTEALGVLEIDTDERIAAVVFFDVDDFSAAIDELNTRYLAGEGAPHAETWSAIMTGYDAVNRREIPPIAADWTDVDHRQIAAVRPGGLIEYLSASFELTAGFLIFVESIFRIDDLGVVVAHGATATSADGFDAEWRMIMLMTFEGDLISRCEMFDETDLDVALARFDELHRSTTRLANTASRLDELFLGHLASQDWNAVGNLLVDDYRSDDRRRVVNAGVRRGRVAAIEDARAHASNGLKNVDPTVIAVRGERLALSRVRFRGHDQRPDAFEVEALELIEVRADERIAAHTIFDLDDIDAAFAELDARYLASEAAGHARTWSVILKGRAALNRRELPPTAPDFVSIDHRRGASFAPGEMTAYIRAGLHLHQDIHSSVEVVHRLSDLGVVYTHVAHGVSRDGFNAEWRGVDLMTVDGDLIDRAEIFDETDLDAAIARFDELRSKPKLDNTATRTWGRLADAFNRRSVDDFLALTSADGHYDDHRRMLRDSRDASERRRVVETFLEMPAGWRLETEHLAVRGARLCLIREVFRDHDAPDRPITNELLTVLEVGDDDLAYGIVNFDVEDVDAAFAELDARYLADEAAPYARTWSVIMDGHDALNRHELPSTTSEFTSVDHRRGGRAFATDDLPAYVRASWDDSPHNTIYIEAVHRLNARGGAITSVTRGDSVDGFAAEWRQVGVITVSGGAIDHAELFDEADVCHAITRFDELCRPATQLSNRASVLYGDFRVYFANRDWEAIAESLDADVVTDDRRRLVGAGIRRGRDAILSDVRGLADVGVLDITFEVIATRGDRLALGRNRSSGGSRTSEPFYVEALDIVEIGAAGTVVGYASFDGDDVDSAFAELEARYVAGEAAAHADTWSAIVEVYASLNRHELPMTTTSSADFDHRRGRGFPAGGLDDYIRATWELVPDLRGHVETVHRLSDRGAVMTQAYGGSSQDGFHAEWREINVLIMDGALPDHCEVFDEQDLDAALARFDELNGA